MGNGQSQTNRAYLKSVGAPPMIKKNKPTQYAQMGSVIPAQNPIRVNRSPLTGVWSIYYNNEPPFPAPRYGHCHVYDESKNSIVIAYGKGNDGNYLNDIWIFDITNFRWKQLVATLHQPRIYASSILVNREMLFFGGSHDSMYLDDFHSVNIDTGVVTEYASGPTPRENAFLAFNGSSLFLWSGNCGQILVDLYEYDTTVSEWRKLDSSDLFGRASASYCYYALEDEYYIFGSTANHSVSKFDVKTHSFELLRCGGLAPPAECAHAMTVIADKYMFVIGGELKKDSTHSYVYVLDLVKKDWFTINIFPDNETTTTADLSAKSSSSDYKIPRQHSGTLVYNKQQRALMSTMGSLLLNPPPINLIRIGDVLSVLHLYDDMLEIMKLTLN